MERMLPEFRLRVDDVSGAMTHTIPFDRSMSEIKIEFAIDEVTNTNVFVDEVTNTKVFVDELVDAESIEIDTRLIHGLNHEPVLELIHGLNHEPGLDLIHGLDRIHGLNHGDMMV